MCTNGESVGMYYRTLLIPYNVDIDLTFIDSPILNMQIERMKDRLAYLSLFCNPPEQPAQYCLIA